MRIEVINDAYRRAEQRFRQLNTNRGTAAKRYFRQPTPGEIGHHSVRRVLTGCLSRTSYLYCKHFGTANYVGRSRMRRSSLERKKFLRRALRTVEGIKPGAHRPWARCQQAPKGRTGDRKSTRLNSSHIPLSRMPPSPS